jgi:hypothetical protein
MIKIATGPNLVTGSSSIVTVDDRVRICRSSNNELIICAERSCYFGGAVIISYFDVIGRFLGHYEHGG